MLARDCSADAALSAGLQINTVHCLEKAGITSCQALVEAWENGVIQRGQPPGINVILMVQLLCWLESAGTSVPETPPKAMVIELSLEAEAALKHFRKVMGETDSQLFRRLLVEADDLARNG